MTGGGSISGRPSTAGAASFVVRVRTRSVLQATKPLFYHRYPPPPPLVIQTVSLPDTTAELLYTQTLQATGGVPLHLEFSLAEVSELE